MKNIFTKNLPHLDLHGLDAISAKILVKEFLNDNYKMRNYELVIIHGIGKGILKKEVHKMLKLDSKVADFKIDYFNLGSTNVELKRKVDKKGQKCYNTRHNLKGEL